MSRQRFQPEFDPIAVVLTLAAGGLLAYFGLSDLDFFRSYWVAYAFWGTGLLVSLTLGFVRLSRVFDFGKVLGVVALAGCCIMIFYGINSVYFALGIDAVTRNRLLGFTIGICEELFFGVFLLGALINLGGLNRAIAVVLSAVIHMGYHIPMWGAEPSLMVLFFSSFLISRFVYVMFYPKVGVIMAAHGIWNWLVS